jgi:hypothetical protein
MRNPFKKEIVIKTIEIDRDLTEIELATKLAEKLGDIDAIEITSEASVEIFRALGNVDGLLDYLRDTMCNDIKRYFAATNDKDRDIIRGGFSRTSYIRARILDGLNKT